MSQIKWKVWCLGAVAACIGGGASCVTAGIAASMVDPEHFNLRDGLADLLWITGATFIVGAVKSVALYFSENPLPKGWDGADRRNGGAR